MSRVNVYLGTRVKDRKPKGLSSLREVRDITKEIIEDYESGRISFAKAKRRLVFLRTTVIPRSEKMRGKVRDAKKIVKKAEERLDKLRAKLEGKSNKKSKRKKRSRK